MKKNNIYKSKKIGLIAAAIIFVLLLLFFILNRFYIDYLWFSEVGFTQIFFKEIITKTEIFIPIFMILVVLLYFYFLFLKKVIAKNSIVVVRSGIRSKFAWGHLAISVVISLLITLLTTNSLWYKLLEFINAKPFNINDPIFNKDVSFYIFKLPFLEQLYAVLSSILTIVFIATIAYTVINYASGYKTQFHEDDGAGIDIKGLLLKLGNITVKQIGIFVGFFFLLLAFNYYLRQFYLLYSSSDIIYGAGYTDSVIRLNLYRVLMVLSLIIAGYSVISGFRKKLKPLLLGPAVIIVVSVAGWVIGAGVENFIVTPNQYTKEEPYLSRHIEYTNMAYGINNVTEKSFNPVQELNLTDIEENEATIGNIPINDYKPTLDIYNSIQGFKVYYEFNDIDIDRYQIDDQYTQVFISARELDNTKLEENARTWINQHLKYTHGFGVAVSPVNRVNEVGQPDLVVKNIPPQTDSTVFSIDEPRIYFGEKTDSYVITNGTTPEFDYPEGSNNQENFYDGTAGIRMNMLNRIVFAVREKTLKILLSSEISSESKMLIRRNIMDRVSTIAPFLLYDPDPYIVVSQGKLYWIIDAFTVSDRYPYAQPYDETNRFNYLRNSVKVVVDAYNGNVMFYQVDTDDPIINAYESIYNDVFTPIDEMPEDLRSHVRYSQEMFDVQSDIYRTYHMTNTKVFYNKEDQWDIPRQIYGASKEIMDVESAYMIMKLPDREEEFTLMVPYTAKEKDNMIAWMSVMNDLDSYGEIVVYTFPKQSLVYGPMQIEQRIDQDTVISPQLTLLGQQGSQVIRGNMLAIPIEESLLYVEPIYLIAQDADRSLPEVKKIIVSYNNKIIMADTLALGLEQIFGKSEQPEEIIEEQPSENIPEETSKEDIAGLITEANRLFEAAQDAQKEWRLGFIWRPVKSIGRCLIKA